MITLQASQKESTLRVLIKKYHVFTEECQKTHTCWIMFIIPAYFYIMQKGTIKIIIYLCATKEIKA